MKTLFLVPAAVALVALSACNSKPEKAEVIDTNPDPMAAQLANKGAVELPPAIKAEKTFRCKDNSLVYVTFFQGDKQAIVKTKKDGAPTTLKAEKAGDPLVAEGGWKLTGDPSHITLTAGGKGEQSCKS
ncbi:MULTISPECIES: hypothetical protein [Sphingomonas]|uniref:C-type lysozyme inhibitor domain-containing protein n=1 Tax=Sphingomonas lycopersici TaxID=2951807 RepID=A0AA41Z9W4_9SPHN|nr:MULTISPECIES: hypothetical protein [Sphingomonas]MCW6532834.1 hypothetical protein [Sphingomonas lycopersici]MCW6535467.1 hypothetical protein [Sphingomonas lycopersici]OJU22740.1 MAG: hypothetical protein BGN95_04020 [Sphingomonas sp. 66-10]